MDLTRVLLVVALLAWGVAHVIPAERSERETPDAGRLFGGWWAAVQRRRKTPVDVGGLVTEVATRLRSGVPTQQACDAAARRAGLPVGVAADGTPASLAALPPSPAAAGARAAWVLAAELGAPLATTLDECARALTHAEENDSARAVALAGPVASARLLASLPVVGIGLGGVIGADPLEQLLGGGVGSLAGLLGLMCYAAGLRWSRALIRSAQGGETTGPEMTVILALVRTAIISGASVPRALQGVGRAIGSARIEMAGKLILLGAEWNEAWHGTNGADDLLRTALEPAWCDGADPIPLLERAASTWQARRDRRAREAAAKLGVHLVLPLGLCYLPAFVLVGILPIVLSTGGGLLA